jgi:hypothetical protein
MLCLGFRDWVIIMRKVLLAMFCIAFFSQANAESLTKKIDWKDTCSKVAQMGTETMKERQNGMTMSDMVNAVTAKPNPAIDIEIKIIQEAYSEPRYNNKSYQDKAVHDFTDRMYLNCSKRFIH